MCKVNSQNFHLLYMYVKEPLQNTLQTKKTQVNYNICSRVNDVLASQITQDVVSSNSILTPQAGRRVKFG